MVALSRSSTLICIFHSIFASYQYDIYILVYYYQLTYILHTSLITLIAELHEVHFDHILIIA